MRFKAIKADKVEVYNFNLILVYARILIRII